MRKTKERLLSLLLALVMLLGLLPGTAWAAEEPIGTVTFSIETKTINGGYIVAPMEEELYSGDTVYTILSRVAEEQGIYVVGADTGYVTKIGTFGSYTDSAYGLESGWMAAINNDHDTWPFPQLKDGDSVRFCYTYKTYGHDIDLIDLVEELTEKAEEASVYEGDNEEAVYAALATATEKLVEIQDYGSNQAYIDALGTMVYGPGSDMVKIQNLILQLETTLTGNEFVATEDVSISIEDGEGNEAAEYVAGRTYYARAVFEPENATWQTGDWELVTGMGADAEITADGALTITEINDDFYGLHMLTVRFWHPEAQSGCFTKAVNGIQGPQTAGDYLNLAHRQLTWDSIKGSNTYSYAVTSDLSIPSELVVDGETVPVSWSCDDATGALSVSNYYGPWGAYVDRPAAQDVSCTLTATLTYGEATVSKEFPITVKAEGVDEDKETVVTYGDLLSGIASGYTSSTNPWVVLEMASYAGENVKSGDYEGASVAAAALANAAIKETVLEDALNGVDISGPYAIYTIPYLSLAYQTAGISSGERMSSMKAAMVDYLNHLETNYAGTDEVTPVLAALAPYYKQGDSGLDAAVDQAVTWLSQQQNANGTFSYYGTPNSNSTALAVVALSALGIDAHTDSRFIKNYKSAMDGLFSFGLANHSGFGYKGNVTKNVLSTEQGFRALVAYARFKENNSPYNIYLQAKDSGAVVTAPNITATVQPPEGGVNPITPVSYTVTVSVMVPPEGGADGQYTYRYNSGQYTNLLGSAQQVSVDQGTTALEVLTEVLDDAGISYTVSSGYVSRIGDLEELDHGPNSGWQYMVNGVAPGESASTYVFSRNSTVVWYYTDDYTKETSSDSWSEKKPLPDAGDAKVTENKDGTYTVALPKDSDGPVLTVIPDVGDGKVIVIVHKDGTETVVKKSLVENGTARLLLEEDAVVKVVETSGTFGDVAQTDWYAGAVDFVSARGLFSGVSEESFAPDLTLSRGMVATVLYALEEPGTQLTESMFGDVSSEAWYLQGLTWAAKEGIVSGYGDNLMGPEDSVTREQLALMLYQYARTLGISTDTKAGLSGFRDREAVSSWAGDAMAWAVDAGLMSGRPDGTLDPAGTATRAEAAVMVRQFVALMLG